jgi:hypothetical protein
MDFFEDSFKARIDSRYYVDRSVPDAQFNKMVESAPSFLVKCRSVLLQLNEKKVNGIRERFLESMK